ncbi:hypothetical protein Brsp01_28880 [Brucella sp. NBRC 12950]|nr:hypothetical protein Brsp01_28880 [Brucella sp. NBRC 12950]
MCIATTAIYRGRAITWWVMTIAWWWPPIPVVRPVVPIAIAISWMMVTPATSVSTIVVILNIFDRCLCTMADGGGYQCRRLRCIGASGYGRYAYAK